MSRTDPKLRIRDYLSAAWDILRTAIELVRINARLRRVEQMAANLNGES